MQLPKHQRKILKYIYKKPRTRKNLLKHFGKLDIENELYLLNDARFISYKPHPKLDSHGFPCEDISLDAIYKIETAGRVDVESTQFFTAEYFLSHILIPIIVGVLSSVIAALILV